MYACTVGNPCQLRNLDLDGDGRVEVLLATSSSILTFTQDGAGQWSQSAVYAACAPGSSEELAKAFVDRFAIAPASLPDLVIGGQRLQAQPQISCPPPTSR